MLSLIITLSLHFHNLNIILSLLSLYYHYIGYIILYDNYTNSIVEYYSVSDLTVCLFAPLFGVKSAF